MTLHKTNRHPWDRSNRDPQPLCRSDLQDMTADIKRTFTAAMADMKAEMRAINTRLGAVEEVHAHRLDDHSDILRDLYRRVEETQQHQGERPT